jgi:lactoylglutathione lyase
MAVEGLHHVAVYTEDIDESIDFYSNLLGFRVYWRGIVDHPTGKIDAAIIRQGDCVIELVRPVDSKRIGKEAGPVQHIALRVSDLPSLLEELSSKEARFEFDGIEELPTLLDGVKHAFIYGPSGERIELAEEM